MQRPSFLDGVFERTATRFLRRIHRMTHRMPVKLVPVERARVLVVAPHPDDEVIAAGGTLALHQRAGSDVLVLYVTLDAPRPDGSVPRRGEAEAAAKLLGFEHRFLGFPDGSVSLHEERAGAAIAEAITGFRPDVVMCPFPGDHHRDHMAVSAATGLAVARSGHAGEVRCYEVWSNLWPNVGVDISSVVDVKRAAIECYASQIRTIPYADGALGLNRFRGIKLRVPYAEAFYACSGREFVQLCRTLAAV